MNLKLFKPSKEFSAKTKERFLAAFDARYGTRPQTQASSRLVLTFKYSLVVLLVIVGTTAGASVYADGKNVPADSAFYSLKRMSEAVQLAVTPAAMKPELQATFAVRRGNEISDLETRTPSSTLLVKLNTDLDSDVNTSVGGIVKQMKKGGTKVNVCGSLLAAIAGDSSSAHTDLLSHPQVIKRFEDRCRALQQQENDGDTGVATTTITATTTVSSTVEASTTENVHDGGDDNDRRGGKLHPLSGDSYENENASISASSSVSTTLDLDL